MKDGATEDYTCYGLQQDGSPLPGLKFGLLVRIKMAPLKLTRVLFWASAGRSPLTGLKFGFWVRMKDGATVGKTCGLQQDGSH
jgi:hypothetical protein